MIELIGYLGSALVVASMLMSSVVKLRVINTIGSGIFAAYADDPLLPHRADECLSGGDQPLQFG